MEKVFIVTYWSYACATTEVVGVFDNMKKAVEVGKEFYLNKCKLHGVQPNTQSQCTMPVEDSRLRIGLVEVQSCELTRNCVFPITFIDREDMADAGYDASSITDDGMYSIASRMGKYYHEGYCDSFREDLIAAAGYLGLKEKED